MFIKDIIIEGFKTYKGQTHITDLSPGHNLILGANGSGKSNIFDAILFVLSDKYGNLRAEDRQLLLHEGVGRATVTASVEIIFDNASGRFPISADEVSIKREISTKKDEFFVQRKHTVKSEVASLLESAGLSRSNPYYIVQQGKVANLIHMRDSERLEVLKEIAGTRTYEERKRESLKIMRNTDQRRQQVEEVISFITSRLTELVGEKKELEKFERLDQERRVLEYKSYEKEVKSAQGELERLESLTSQASSKTETLQERLHGMRETRLEREERLRAVSEKRMERAAASQRLQTAVREAVTRKAQLEVRVRAGQERSKLQAGEHQQLSGELKQLEKDIASENKKLAKLQAEYDEQRGEVERMTDELQQWQGQLNALHAKEERGARFSSAEERNQALAPQLKALKASLRKEQAQLRALQREVTSGQQSLSDAQEAVEIAERNVTGLTEASDGIAAELQQLSEQRDTLSDQRKALWKEQAAVKKQLAAEETASEKAERQLRYSMDPVVYRGLQAVRQLTDELGLQSNVFGPLVELFTCPVQFQLAVEVTARNALLHVVVDTDDTAAKLIAQLQERKLGRVTFVPLNRIRPKEVKFPKTPVAVPLIEKLQFDDRYRKAMLQVFGRCMVARNLQTAAANAREHHLDTVTLQGQQVNHKGAFHGGFVDHKVSRIACFRQVAQTARRLEALEEKSGGLSQQVGGLDQRITQISASMHKLREKRDFHRKSLPAATMDVQAARQSVQLAEKSLSESSDQLRQVERSAASGGDEVKRLETEMASEFQAELSSQEKKLVAKLTRDGTARQTELVAMQGRLAQVETQRTNVEQLLSEQLLKRKAELEALLARGVAVSSEVTTEDNAMDLAEVADRLQLLSTQLQEEDAGHASLEAEAVAVRKQMEEEKGKEDRTLRALNKESKVLERLLQKRTILAKKIEEYNAKIGGLGALPSAAFDDKRRAQTIASMMKRLKKINQQLKKFAHVNKKAIEQYQSFSKQKRDLEARKSELDEGRASILQLIDQLDMKKQEAIDGTFRDIAKHFSTVFAQLVPGGRAQLLIVEASGQEGALEAVGEDDEERKLEGERKSTRRGRKRGRNGGSVSASSPSSAGSNTERYAGITIQVQFANTPQRLSQLSGGQQSVVALSLIFAFQRCDPSPFYIFDEIDSNLDEVHRAAVAKMVAQQKQDAQFIITTFRPELVAGGDKCFGVTSENKASVVREISLREAKQFVSQMVAQEQNK